MRKYWAGLKVVFQHLVYLWFKMQLRYYYVSIAKIFELVYNIAICAILGTSLMHGTFILDVF